MEANERGAATNRTRKRYQKAMKKLHRMPVPGETSGAGDIESGMQVPEPSAPERRGDASSSDDDDERHHIVSMDAVVLGRTTPVRFHDLVVAYRMLAQAYPRVGDMLLDTLRALNNADIDRAKMRHVAGAVMAVGRKARDDLLNSGEVVELGGGKLGRIRHITTWKGTIQVTRRAASRPLGCCWLLCVTSSLMKPLFVPYKLTSRRLYQCRASST